MNNEVKDLTCNVKNNSDYDNKNIFLRFVIEILKRIFDDNSMVEKIGNSIWFKKF